MWPNPQETADFVTFTEKILNGKLHFLCSETRTNLISSRLIFRRAISLPHPIRRPKNGKSAADNKSNKSNILENASRQIHLITVLMAGLSLDN